jgi:hypothetical protein
MSDKLQTISKLHKSIKHTFRQPAILPTLNSQYLKPNYAESPPCATIVMSALKTIHFSEVSQWTWKQRDTLRSITDDIASFSSKPAEWRQVATVPSCIHLDLLKHNLIPEPFTNRHENDLQWIGEKDWLYRVVFDVAASDLRSGLAADLVFEGLDTISTVFINGVEVLKVSQIPHCRIVLFCNWKVAFELGDTFHF